MKRSLYRPRPATVEVGSDGLPITIGKAAVDAVREEWLVEDRWWTNRPLRRHYYEVMTVDGADRVVFRDLESGRWYSQSGA